MSEGVPDRGVPDRGVPDWGVPDWAEDAGDGEAGPVTAPPVDVAAQVRRRRRSLVLGAVGLVTAYVVFLVVLSLVAQAWPTFYAWVLLAVVLVLAGVWLWPLRNPAGRAAWDERTGRLVRIDAALRDQESVGEDERDDVTAGARHRRQLTGLAWFGYPLLALFMIFLLFNSDSISALVAWVGTLAAVVLCGLGLLNSYRRDVEARRWLAQLPPEPEAEPRAAGEPVADDDDPDGGR